MSACILSKNSRGGGGRGGGGHTHVLLFIPLQTNPLMIRIEEKAGHGAGKPTTKLVSGTVADSRVFSVEGLRARSSRHPLHTLVVLLHIDTTCMCML